MEKRERRSFAREKRVGVQAKRTRKRKEEWNERAVDKALVEVAGFTRPSSVTFRSSSLENHRVTTSLATRKSRCIVRARISLRYASTDDDCHENGRRSSGTRST